MNALFNKAESRKQNYRIFMYSSTRVITYELTTVVIIYNYRYLCNQYLSQRCEFESRSSETTLCDKVCQ